MEEEKIVYQGQTKKGKAIVIRYPKQNDLEEMTAYINTLSKEQTFIMFQGEEVSLQEETSYLTDQLNKIQKNQAVLLVVIVDNHIVGISGIDLRKTAEKHVGNFGISVAKDYRGEGLGKLLMQIVLKESHMQIPQLQIITLGVFANNSIAQNMYHLFGFTEYGTLPKGLLHKEDYIDHIYMYKFIK